MRSLLLAIIAAALGIVSAWGATRYEFRENENVIPVATTGPRAKVVVEDGLVHDFGTMQVGETRENVFVFRNDGDLPLELTALQPSCKCTVSEVSGGPVMPGESREVLVSWTPRAMEEGFKQRAPIQTNDPDQPIVELRIQGRVTESFKVEPNPLTLGQFSPMETSTHDINVWGFQPEPWKFKSYECLDEKNASFFTLEARDMTPAEVAEKPGAVNGQVLTLTVKAGLPLGQVSQRINIMHNDETQPVELAVTGKAVGDITVVGRDFNAGGNFVDLGNIPRSTGKKSTLSVLVKGPQRNRIKLKIRGTDPQDSLKATLGEPTAAGGKSVSWPLTVEIPPGSEPVNRLGSELGAMGRIELETDVPELPTVVIKLRYSVAAEE